ncbi:hypothetical protein DER29_6053 [Micromonospora sp. M71_S20]|nr:hypothetical protein DER29_6053 [Micromonospora sp. M71_S20]
MILSGMLGAGRPEVDVERVLIALVANRALKRVSAYDLRCPGRYGCHHDQPGSPNGRHRLKIKLGPGDRSEVVVFVEVR